MKKIPSLFVRDWNGDRSRVLDQINPEAQWVLTGRALPYRKRDGTAVLVSQDGLVYRRFDAKKGRKPPASFIEASPPDPLTGHWPGWVFLVKEDPTDMWFFTTAQPNVPGTYEFCGPKVNGNPERLIWHQYIKHDSELLLRTGDDEVPCHDLATLKGWFEQHLIEGIVWHEIGGEGMAKIKRKDLGLPWPLVRSS